MLRPFLLGFETVASRVAEADKASGSDRSFWDLKPKKVDLPGLMQLQAQTVPSGI